MVLYSNIEDKVKDIINNKENLVDIIYKYEQKLEELETQYDYVARITELEQKVDDLETDKNNLEEEVSDMERYIKDCKVELESVKLFLEENDYEYSRKEINELIINAGGNLRR